jgi:2-polyprenyl-3-methyl-5-hydroxy-6-metoxy-1,4-benzoquinol methylase
MRQAVKANYAQMIQDCQGVWWKRLLPVQAPYRWNLRRLKLGRTLDVGCGLGRNLAHLDGVGIDPEQECVRIARSRGLSVFEPHEFTEKPESFDSLLIAHVLEHLPPIDALNLVRDHVPYVRRGGRVVMITPQEWNFRSCPTHINFADFAQLARIATELGLIIEKKYSFPFPRWAANIFKYNEFVVVARKP